MWQVQYVLLLLNGLPTGLLVGPSSSPSQRVKKSGRYPSQITSEAPLATLALPPLLNIDISNLHPEF